MCSRLMPTANSNAMSRLGKKIWLMREPISSVEITALPLRSVNGASEIRMASSDTT